MSQSSPLVIYQKNTGWHEFNGQSGIYVAPPSGPAGPTFHANNVHNMLWATVLKRSDITAKPVYQEFLTSNTEVPQALADAMVPQNILIFLISATPAHVPQGDLFKLLMANGAGAKLQKGERLATFIACGVFTDLLYSLVSIPGSNMPGDEHDRDGFITYDLVDTQSGVLPVRFG